MLAASSLLILAANFHGDFAVTTPRRLCFALRNVHRYEDIPRSSNGPRAHLHGLREAIGFTPVDALPPIQARPMRQRRG